MSDDGLVRSVGGRRFTVSELLREFHATVLYETTATSAQCAF
jgi:hypothetical protein